MGFVVYSFWLLIKFFLIIKNKNKNKKTFYILMILIASLKSY